MKGPEIEPTIKPAALFPARHSSLHTCQLLGCATIAGKCHERLRVFGNPSTWVAGHPAETSRSAGTEPGTALCNFLTRSKRKKREKLRKLDVDIPLCHHSCQAVIPRTEKVLWQGPSEVHSDFINRNMQKITRSPYS